MARGQQVTRILNIFGQSNFILRTRLRLYNKRLREVFDGVETRYFQFNQFRIRAGNCGVGVGQGF